MYIYSINAVKDCAENNIVIILYKANRCMAMGGKFMR